MKLESSMKQTNSASKAFVIVMATFALVASCKMAYFDQKSESEAGEPFTLAVPASGIPTITIKNLEATITEITLDPMTVANPPKAPLKTGETMSTEPVTFTVKFTYKEKNGATPVVCAAKAVKIGAGNAQCGDPQKRDTAGKPEKTKIDAYRSACTTYHSNPKDMELLFMDDGEGGDYLCMCKDDSMAWLSQLKGTTAADLGKELSAKCEGKSDADQTDIATKPTWADFAAACKGAESLSAMTTGYKFYPVEASQVCACVDLNANATIYEAEFSAFESKSLTTAENIKKLCEKTQ